MPIRFRCAYCNQLLGIARRKAGTVVRCPTCAGQVVVPNVDAADEDRPKGQGDEPLFERSDFDDLFNAPQAQIEEPRTGAGGGAAAGTAAPKAPPSKPAPAAEEDAWGTHAEPDVEPLGVPPGSAATALGTPRPPGIVLSPAKATVLTVLVVVGLAVAFGAGLLVGKFMLGGP
jgi:hypothetical protein